MVWRIMLSEPRYTASQLLAMALRGRHQLGVGDHAVDHANHSSAGGAGAALV